LELSERGPDGAGFAVYAQGDARLSKIAVVASPPVPSWRAMADELARALSSSVRVEAIEDHAIFTTDADGAAARAWLIQHRPCVTVLSQGHSIEIFKSVGAPHAIAARLRLAETCGTHAIGHTRIAPESAVTIAGSHPFSTGEDTCLVHNGSLSNHNELRRALERQGERFQTDNDSEVAAGYLTWRTRAGDNLQ